MKKCFFAGLVALLPLLVTYIVIAFGIDLITSPFEHLVRYTLSHIHLFDRGVGIFTREQLIFFVSKVLIIITIIAIVILVGMLAHWVFFHSLGYFFDRLLSKIPFINKIYSSSKDLVNAIFMERPGGERKSVLAPYPTPDQCTVGIVTSEYVATIHDKEDTFVSVFVPSTPNATAGYLCNFPKTQVVYLDLSADEALKFVMGLAGSSVRPSIKQ